MEQLAVFVSANASRSLFYVPNQSNNREIDVMVDIQV